MFCLQTNMDSVGSPHPKNTANEKGNIFRCECYNELVEQNLNLLRDKHSNDVTNKMKERVWLQITEKKIYALGNAYRTPSVIRTK